MTIANSHRTARTSAPMSRAALGVPIGLVARLLNFTPERGIEANEINVPATDHLIGYRHFHSSRSNFVDVDSSRSTSSPTARIRFAAAAQPLRGPRAAWTTNRPGWAWSSTSSGRSASSSSVFGIRIPRELPILTIRAFVAIVITVYLRRLESCKRPPGSVPGRRRRLRDTPKSSTRAVRRFEAARPAVAAGFADRFEHLGVDCQLHVHDDTAIRRRPNAHRDTRAAFARSR